MVIEHKKKVDFKYDRTGNYAFDLENFKELMDLIPLLQEKFILGLKREFKKPQQLNKIINTDTSFIEEISSILSGKWTINILYMIFFLGKPFYNELKNALPKINTKTLTIRLSNLTEKRIIKRVVHNKRPIRVSYRMTTFGRGLMIFYLSIVFYSKTFQNNINNDYII